MASIVKGGGVVLDADECALLAPVLRQALREVIVGGGRVNVRAATAIRSIAAVAGNARGGCGSTTAQPVPSTDGSSCDVTVAQAARAAGVSEEAVRKWIRSGALPYRRLGARYALDATDVAEMISRRTGGHGD